MRAIVLGRLFGGRRRLGLVAPVLAPVLALGLIACQPQAPGGAEAPPPADASEDIPAPAAAFADEIMAVGTEPFWGLRIRKTEITLEQLGEPSAKGPNQGSEESGAQTIWRTTTAGGDALVVTLWEETCSDGMSDLAYAYQARVQLGDKTLSGCAGKADAMPREGG